MWGPFSAKRASVVESSAGDNPPMFGWRQELELTTGVTNFIKRLLDDQHSLTAFAGGVFALQQDVKLAMGANLWDAVNVIRPVIEEKGVRLPGANITRTPRDAAKLAISVHDIMVINAEFVEKYNDRYKANPPAHLDPKELEAHAFLAGIRNKAAGLWLVTIMPYSQDNAAVPLAATNAWLMLSMIRVEALLYAAKTCTGGHFNGVECKEFSVSDWPQIIR